MPNCPIDGRLRDETFGSGRIILREEPEAIAVPNESVHWEGCCFVVFVRDKHYFDSPNSPKVFHVRSVRIGAVTRSSPRSLRACCPVKWSPAREVMCSPPNCSRTTWAKVAPVWSKEAPAVDA